MMFLLEFHFPYVAIHGPYSARNFGRSFSEIAQTAAGLFRPGLRIKEMYGVKRMAKTAKPYNDFALRLLNRAVA